MKEEKFTTGKDDALKASELAPILKVSRRTILNWHQDGVIPAEINIGRVIRFSLPEVRKALKERTYA